MSSASVAARAAASQREMILWAVLGTMAAGLLVAFWMLCSDQVRKAEQRDAGLRMQRIAMTDCLRYMPQSTMSSCAGQGQSPDGALNAMSTMGGSVPVNFTFR
jgi:bacteriorhodopsin